MVSSQYFQVLKREKAKLVLENKENAAKFLDPEEKRRKADYGKNIKGNWVCMPILKKIQQDFETTAQNLLF